MLAHHQRLIFDIHIGVISEISTTTITNKCLMSYVVCLMAYGLCLMAYVLWLMAYVLCFDIQTVTRLIAVMFALMGQHVWSVDVNTAML